MVKKIILLLLVITVSAMTLHAGKNATPVDTPIRPVPTESISPFYIGGGVIWGRYYGCNAAAVCEYEDITYGAMLRAGYEWNEYLGIEVRALGTFWEEDPLGGEKLKHYGIYAKPQYPISEDFNLYALVGYGVTKTETIAGGLLPTIDDNGLSAGVGIEYDLSDKEDDRDEDTIYDREFDGQADQERGWGLFLDYQRLLIKSGVPDMDVVSFGATYDF